MCPHCHHRLHARDLIPVLSWVALRGRCRYCQAGISWQYPLVEVLTAAVFVASFVFWPYDFTGAAMAAFGVWLVCLVMLIALMVYDLRWMLLPNRLVYPLTVVAAVLAICLAVEVGQRQALAGSLLGSLGLSGLFYGMFQVSGGRWIGGGDVKLAVALGLVAGGILESILLLFIASLLGSVLSIPLLMNKKKLSQKVAFGPFLIGATIIVFLFGSSIIAWYSQQFIGV